MEAAPNALRNYYCQAALPALPLARPDSTPTLENVSLAIAHAKNARILLNAQVAHPTYSYLEAIALLHALKDSIARILFVPSAQQDAANARRKIIALLALMPIF